MSATLAPDSASSFESTPPAGPDPITHTSKVSLPRLSLIVHLFVHNLGNRASLHFPDTAALGEFRSSMYSNRRSWRASERERSAPLRIHADLPRRPALPLRQFAGPSNIPQTIGRSCSPPAHWLPKSPVSRDPSHPATHPQ